jgi:WD40 repeat protein
MNEKTTIYFQHHPYLRGVLILLVAVLGVTFVQPARSASLGQEIQTVQFPEVVTTIAWSPDGTHLAAANNRDNQVYLYDLTQHQMIWKVGKVGPRPSTSLAFDESGQTIITPSTINWGMEQTNTTLSLLNAESGTVVRQLSVDLPENTVGTGRVERFSLSHDKSTLAAIQGTNPNRILTYDTHTWTVIDRIEVGRYGAWRIAIDEKSHNVVVAFIGGEVETWDPVVNKLIKKFVATNSTIAEIATNPTSGALVIAGSGVIMGRRIAAGDGPNAFTTLTDDPSLLVAAWNPLTGEKVITYVGPGVGVSGLAVSPDGKYVAATKGKGPGRGTYLLVWDADSGNQIGQVDYAAVADGVAFSEDGSKLAVAVGSVVHIIPITD